MLNDTSCLEDSTIFFSFLGVLLNTTIFKTCSNTLFYLMFTISLSGKQTGGNLVLQMRKLRLRGHGLQVVALGLAARHLRSRTGVLCTPLPNKVISTFSILNPKLLAYRV